MITGNDIVVHNQPAMSGYVLLELQKLWPEWVVETDIETDGEWTFIYKSELLRAEIHRVGVEDWLQDSLVSMAVFGDELTLVCGNGMYNVLKTMLGSFNP